MQAVGHEALVELHTYGAQLGLPAAPATLVHVPLELAPSVAEHVSQAPLQALLQQTPSAQKPEAH